MPQELVNLYFDNNFVDSTDRHTFTNTGVIIAPSEVSSACAQFDGQSYLSTDNNLSDFLLGATPNPHTWTGQPPLSIFNDNNFTFDCWIYPELGGARYYPICSSFASEYWGASYKTGWSIQLDTATGHLQMIGYYGNLWTNCLLEYNFQIVFNQWTHISIMSWRVTGQSAPSAKIVFKNGSPAVVTTGDLYPNMGFTNGINNSNSQYQYAPFYVGLGPSSQFTNPGESWLRDLTPNYYFKGKIDSLRICLGPRFLSLDENNYIVGFTPPGAVTTTSTTVTTITTTTTPQVLTRTTSTTSSTQTTSTTSIQTGYLGSLVALPFTLTTNDLTQRHVTTSNFNYYTADNLVPGGYCAEFTGGSDIEYIYDLADWTLNSTNCSLYCQRDVSWAYLSNYPDNYFTIDCWIKLIDGGTQYYPICSSFNSVGTGWSFQVNTSTMKLQFVGFALQTHVIDLSQNSTAKDQNGSLYQVSSINLLLESNFTLEYDTWTHIAITSYRVANQTSAKVMYLNGEPDRLPNSILANCVWSNRGQINTNSPVLSYGTLKIGSSPVYSLPTYSSGTNYFSGYINNLEIVKGNKFPIDGSSFLPHLVGLDITSTTSTSTTVTSTTTATSSSETTTQTTQSTSSTVSTTLYISQIEDLLLCPFVNDTRDVTSRHSLSYTGRSYITDNAFLFDGSSYFLVNDRLEDFMLGATPVRANTSSSSFASGKNNIFTFDCWVNFYPGGGKYYPICSSFVHAIYGIMNPPIGWFIQVDMETGHLQVGGLNNLNSLYTSSFTLPINETNQWSHVAVMMWLTTYQGLPINMISAYLNGIPDRFIPLPNAGPSLSNVFFGADGLLTGYYSSVYVGLSPKTRLTDPNETTDNLLNVNNSYKFVGKMRGVRFCQGLRYPVLKELSIDRLVSFTPPTIEGLPITSTITSTTSTSSTTQILTTTLTTGTTTTYSTTTTWISSTITYTTMTPIPPYTNVSLEGTATASGFMVPYYPSNAFNNNSNTFWLCNPFDDPPYWLTYELTEEAIVDQYKLFLTSGGRPKSWKLQGSPDNTNWTILDEQVDIETEGLLTFLVSNSTSYLYYRLYITEVWSRSYGIRVNEFQLYANCHVNRLESSLHWLGTDLKQPTLVQRYCLNVPDGSTFTEWKLQGSDDNYFWLDVDHQVSPEWVGWKCIDIESNNLSFNKWRILILNWNSNSSPGLTEFEIFHR